MKELKLFIVALCVALPLFCSCDEFPIIGDDPSKEEPAGSSIKYVKSVEILDYEDGVLNEPFEIIDYKYNDDKITEVDYYKATNFSNKWPTKVIILDYSNQGEIRMCIDDKSSSNVQKMVLKQQHGKTIISYSYENFTADKYELNYDSDGYFVELKDVPSSNDYIVKFNHTSDGILSGLEFYVNGDLSYEESYDVDRWYPNRYINNNVNIDLNYFLSMTFRTPSDFFRMFGVLGLCGKLSVCYSECYEEFWYDSVEWTWDANYNEHVVKDEYVHLNNGFDSIVYKFDTHGCPTEMEQVCLYNKIEVECDLVASSNPVNPEEPQEHWRYEIIESNRNERVISTVKNSKIIKITYR